MLRGKKIYDILLKSVFLCTEFFGCTNMKVGFIKTILSNVIQINKIVTIHDFEFDETFSFAGETHDFWELAYIDKGEIIYFHDKGETVVSKGEIFFIAPNCFHASKALNSCPSCINIAFECKSLAMKSFENYHAKVDASLLPFLNSIIEESRESYDIPKNAITLTKLKKKKEPKIGSEQLIRTYLEQFLILLLRSMSEKQEFLMFPSKESMQHHLVEDIKHYVNEKIEQIIRIEDICKHLGYSKTYLSKIFHEYTGCTLAYYINKVKINKAKELIRERKLNFSEISDKLAFDNPQYFSRVFKKFCGMNPSEFRSSVKGK